MDGSLGPPIPAEIGVELEAICKDRLSGARVLARRGAGTLLRLAGASRADSVEGFQKELSAICKALLAAQPLMAPLVNLANDALWAVQGAATLEEVKVALIAAAQGFACGLEASGRRIIQEALPLIPAEGSVLTHSYSSTVLDALLEARREGRGFAVVCTESRPQCEGRSWAERLAEAGIETVLVVDAAAPGLVEDVGVVLVGADSLSTEGLVNKIGTYSLALAAQAHRVPFYALCGTEKFVPQGYALPKEGGREPEEVWPDYPQGVRIINRYFDLTPLPYLTGVVTEKGVLRGHALEEVLGRRRLHPALGEVATGGGDG